MFRLKIREKVNHPNDFLFICLSNIFIATAIASIVLFDQIVEYYFLGYHITVSAAIIAYVLLYPILFVALRIYGSKAANQMIIAMLIAELFFVLLCSFITSLHFSSTPTEYGSLRTVLQQAVRWYICGIFALPAGMYAGIITLIFMMRFFKELNIIAIFTATVAGEFINTLILFPLGCWGKMSWLNMWHLMTDALLFKIISAFVLGIPTVFLIKLISTKFKCRQPIIDE